LALKPNLKNKKFKTQNGDNQNKTTPTKQHARL